MKKNSLALVLACMLFACQKSTVEAPKTGVTFQFSNFNWQVGPLEKSGASVSESYIAADTLSKYTDHFYYRAYNSAGQKVSEKAQSAGSEDFGFIKDNLDPGTYTIVFAASKKPLGFSHYGFQQDHFYNQANSYWEDTFYKAITVSVGTESSTHPVKLERVVGALEVKLLDQIPANAAKLQVSVEFEHGVYNLTGSSAATSTKAKEFILTNADKGVSGRKFLMHILNVSRPLNITIKSFDDSNVILAEKKIDNVSFQQNRKTLLEGNLWASSQFQVAVDPVWGTPMAPIKF